MESVNLLQFLNIYEELSAPNFATCELGLFNFFDLFGDEPQFTQEINLGVFYVSQKTLDRCIVIDGINRIISLSLLLHAVCECYKKTTPKNEKAIKIIRSKYLLNGDKTKLKLPDKYQSIYNKIIFGERLSGKEKESPLFKLLHELWTQIKTNELNAANIFTLLQKVYIYVVNSSGVNIRDLYYSLNNKNKELNHILLIDSFMEEQELLSDWNIFKQIFDNKTADILLFFKDFFITKFNNDNDTSDRLYMEFSNYFMTMLMYVNKNVIMSKLVRSANVYNDILNVNLSNPKLKKLLVQIKMHNGEDTYAYLLNIYEDYLDGNLTEETLVEILLTIDEYLKNRLKTPNNVSFNELIKYLNAFITCK